MKKKIVSILLAISLAAALVGCGQGDGASPGGDGTAENGSASDGSAEGGSAGGSSEDGSGSGESGSTAMGRYVEQETEFPGEEIKGMYRLEDGSLVVTTGSSGIFKSTDGGETWENEVPDWYKELDAQDKWISSMAVAPDGTVGVIYPEYEELEDYKCLMLLVDKDGNQTEVVFPEKGNAYPCDAFVTEDNRIFVSMVGSKVLYEVFADGSTEAFLETDSRVERLCIQGNLMIFDHWGDDGSEATFLYDMEKKEYIEDEVLSDFLQENYKDRYYNGSDYGEICIFTGEDQALYIGGKKGLHRHALGGNMMEQVIDGNLSMLSNPYYQINNMFCMEGDSFLALFGNGKLIRFTYDATVPTVPEHMLKIYSLKEDDLIRQAISVYQASQQEVFVSYEVGMEEGGAVTRDDALKKLNTEIMAGEGPDLLVMDGLPIDSYAEKGLLLDLTDYFAQYSAKDPLFDNIIDALQIDGKAYMAPGSIQLPMVVGRERYVKNITDLSSVADAVEQVRKDNPGKNILGICTGAGVLKRFACVSEPLWRKEDGSLDRAVLEEYLTECKRIYDAQMGGLDEEILEYLKERNIRVQSYTGISRDMEDMSLYMEMMNYAYDDILLPFGWATYGYGYVSVISANRQEGCEDTLTLPMVGQCSNVFMPKTMLAVSAASAQPEEAKGFLDVFLSSDVQSGNSYLPVNRAGFQKVFTANPEWLGEDGSYGGETASWGDGTIQTYNVYWPADEQIADLQKTYEALSTPYISDSVVEDAVFEQGEAYLNGEQSLEEALDAIEKAVSIYMAE